MRVVVMGVTGCGKTTIGSRLAASLAAPFFDGDDFHPPENVAKMRAGEPLTDEDRIGWLEALRQLLNDNENCVLACSALKERYRQVLRQDNVMQFVHLEISPQVAQSRLANRKDHYMPASLVASQFEALESPHNAITIDGTQPVDVICQSALDKLGAV